MFQAAGRRQAVCSRQHAARRQVLAAGSRQEPCRRQAAGIRQVLSADSRQEIRGKR
jgi:hypothetical protein